MHQQTAVLHPVTPLTSVPWGPISQGDTSSRGFPLPVLYLESQKKLVLRNYFGPYRCCTVTRALAIKPAWPVQCIPSSDTTVLWLKYKLTFPSFFWHFSHTIASRWRKEGRKDTQTTFATQLIDVNKGAFTPSILPGFFGGYFVLFGLFGYMIHVGILFYWFYMITIFFGTADVNLMITITTIQITIPW